MNDLPMTKERAGIRATDLRMKTDRGTCVLFGDGAGAVVLEPQEGQGTTADRGLLGFALRADGTKQDLLYVDGGVSTDGQVGKLRMQGCKQLAVAGQSADFRARHLFKGVDEQRQPCALFASRSPRVKCLTHRIS